MVGILAEVMKWLKEPNYTWSDTEPPAQPFSWITLHTRKIKDTVREPVELNRFNGEHSTNTAQNARSL